MLIFDIMCDKKDIIEVLGKNCSKCKEFKVWDEFYNCSKVKDGKTSSCKECESIRSVKKKLKRELISEEDRLKIVTETRGVDIGKICYKCDEFKVWDEFHNNCNMKDGKESYCKECRRKKRYLSKGLEVPDIIETNHYSVDDGIDGKICCGCEKFKEFEHFHNSSRNKDGKKSSCKECRKKFYDDNKGFTTIEVNHYTVDDGIDEKQCGKCEKFKVWDDYYSSKVNKDGKQSFCIECNIVYRQENKESISKRKKIRYQENKESISKRNKIRYQLNKEERLEKCRIYRENNKDIVRESNRKYVKKRRAIDPLFKLRRAITSNISYSIKKQGYTKRTKTYKILKCSFEDFLDHLNNNPYNFTFGDDNLDLDHIIPISTANTEDEVYELNHYTNFQLLPSDYNRHIKSDNPWDREDFERWLYG